MIKFLRNHEIIKLYTVIVKFINENQVIKIDKTSLLFSGIFKYPELVYILENNGFELEADKISNLCQKYRIKNRNQKGILNNRSKIKIIYDYYLNECYFECRYKIWPFINKWLKKLWIGLKWLWDKFNRCLIGIENSKVLSSWAIAWGPVILFALFGYVYLDLNFEQAILALFEDRN